MKMMKACTGTLKVKMSTFNERKKEMTKPMRQLIADSARAYAIILNNHCKRSATTRYAVYVETEDGLKPLWPIDNGEKLLDCQVYSKLENYPAYHFVVSGFQFNHLHEIRRALKIHNPSITVYALRGWYPSENN